MAFLDDDPIESGGSPPRGKRPPPGGRPPPPDRHQQLLIRRAVAVGAFVLLIILIVVGFRGCLNARKERGFENYVSDLSSIAAETQNLSKGFFGRLEDNGELTELQFEAEIKADRGAMEGLLDRAEGLDAPDELADQQELIVLSYELRRDGLAVISDSIGAALGNEGSAKAIDEIAAQMKVFLASDVIYGKAEDGIETELSDQEIVVPEGENITTQFLPDEPDWLDPNVVADALGGSISSGGGGEKASGGVRGLGLVEGGVLLLPSGSALTEGATLTDAADGAELEVQVQNQGESDETDVVVSYEFDGSSGEETIDSIASQEIATVNVPLKGIAAGSTGELTVTAEPVPGEEVEENNSITATVTFE